MNGPSSSRRFWRVSSALLAAALLLAPLGCGDDSEGGNNGAANNGNNGQTNNNGNNGQTNNNGNNGQTNNGVTNNGVTNNGNNGNNGNNDVAECQRLCGVVTACQEFIDACGETVTAQANTACMGVCADDADARAQILAVGNLPCATVVPLAIDGFGLSDACGGGNNGGECTADAFEPNDTEEDIAELQPNNATHDLSICVGDVDIFALPLAAGDTARITFLFSHDTADLDVDAIIDDGVAPIDISSTSGSDNEYLGVPAQEGDVTVLFAVYSYDEGGSSPYTLQVEINPTAAPCNRDSQCAEGEVCLPNATCGEIPPCTTDEDCYAFGLSSCDTASGACVQCAEDDDCFGGVCDTTTNTCVECRTSDDCFGGDVCTTDGSCVECLGNSDCADGVCDTDSNSCVECLADGDCTDGTCNTEFNRCIPNACAADPFEPNETFDAAAALTAGEHTGLYICLDDDWFSINVPTDDSTLYIEVLFSDEDGDIDVELLAADGTTDIAGSYGTRDNEYVAAGGLATGTYLLHVYGYAGAVAPYSLNLSINDPNITACDVDSDCAMGQECGNRGVCLATGTCAVDRDCDFGDSCNTANTCVECTKDADCSSDACDLTTFTCYECDDNADCFSNACNTDTHTCLECSTDEDCFFGDICSTDGECVECAQDDQCDSGACDEATNTCLECDDNADCLSEVCDTTRNVCLECDDATDCAEGEICSASGVCIDASCVPDSAEPNDDRQHPYSLEGNLSPATTFNTCDETGDWFSFPVNAGQEITVLVSFTHADGDIDATLYDPDGTSISSGFSTSDNEELTATAETSGVYVVNVRGFLGASNEYTIAITLQ